MKPSFALNLTEDGVTLLHRTARGWLDVGHTTFSDPDLPAALDYLRSTALGLAPKGISTKLVIPNSQILYTEVEAPGPTDDDRRAQIAAALVGRTPYAVEDLVYDWSGSGSTLQVAVVAKETLAEAESFATEHRFNPVSFVAIPDGGFAGEPFFGTTSAASAGSKKSEKVERDSEAIRIVTREMPKPADEAKAEPEAAPPAEELPPAEVAAEPVPAPAVEQVAEPEPEPAPESLPEPAPQPAEAEAAKAPRPFAPASAPEDIPAKDHEADEAPMALDVPEDDMPPALRKDAPAAASERPAASVLDDDLPPAPSSAALAAFASRRSAEAPFPPARSAGVADPKLPPASTVTPLGGAAPAAAAAPAVTAPTVPRPAGAKPPPEKPAPRQPKFSYDDPVPPPPRMPGDPPSAPQTVAPTKSGKGTRNLVTSPTIPGTRNNRPAPGPTRAAVTPGATSAADVNPNSLALGLGGRKAPQRGKPRFLGLILTGILLVLLAVIAALSSVYLGANDPLETPPPQEDVASLPAAPGDIPAPDDEMLADMQDPADFVPGVALDAADASANAAPDAIQDPTADEVADQVAADTATPPADEAEPTAVATPTPPAEVPQPEVAQVDPAPQTGLDAEVGAAPQPGPEGQDEIFLAGMDALPTVTDPLTLAAPAASGDTLPGPQMPPPPFGTVYRFDENGRIIPTAEGITTPEGVTLVSGRPAILPPQRPAAIEAAAATTAPPAADATAPAAAAPAAEAVTTAVTPTETFAADPALQSARPRTRPADLVPAAPAGGEDDASLAPAEDSRFASLRPRLRPASVLAAGETARRTSDAASLAVQAVAASAAPEAAVAEAVANTSPLAVSVSRVPAPRPRNMENAVQAAVAAATQPNRTARSESVAPEKAAPEEEADSEPEVASAAPRIPTRANVAKNATYVNAINLGQTNLVGVYGTQSKRYALIRQSNGRYKKVRVGDSVDGGTVQAITAREVRYQKGGRLVTLAMPRG
jgi:hypothetical protein